LSAARSTLSLHDALPISLPVGTYDVTAELSGFATVVQNDVRLAVGATQSIAFRLTVASLEETITVTGEAPLIETKRSDLGGQIRSEEHTSELQSREKLVC